MFEENSSLSDQRPASEGEDATMNIHERAITIQKKVSELSTTIERIEQNLAEAGNEWRNSRDQ